MPRQAVNLVAQSITTIQSKKGRVEGLGRWSFLIRWEAGGREILLLHDAHDVGQEGYRAKQKVNVVVDVQQV